jgi:alkylation response protein AidB-like acyl-CoA dehydrogenase
MKQLYDWLDQNENKLRERGFYHDREGTFPTETFDELREQGFTRLTVPEQYGGMGASLTEFLRMQQRLAAVDGASALSLGWHNGLVYHIAAYDLWEGELSGFLFKEAASGALFNAASTERASGSPTRGGMPETKAVLRNGSWFVNGRKAFTTMLPVLDYAQVSAVIEETGEHAYFFVPLNLPGVRMEETWNSAAMRSTGSHDLVLQNVELPGGNRIEMKPQPAEPGTGWLLHIPACYLGIAEAAFHYAADFSLAYSPNSLEGTISTVPHVRQKVGEMSLLLKESEAVLYYTAEKWEKASKEERVNFAGDLAAAKHIVINNGLQIVDLAMRTAGARSLEEDNPLQRYHRDIRAGLHNPPMDDAVIEKLASDALGK